MRFLFCAAAAAAATTLSLAASHAADATEAARVGDTFQVAQAAPPKAKADDDKDAKAKKKKKGDKGGDKGAGAAGSDKPGKGGPGKGGSGKAGSDKADKDRKGSDRNVKGPAKDSGKKPGKAVDKKPDSKKPDKAAVDKKPDKAPEKDTGQTYNYDRYRGEKRQESKPDKKPDAGPAYKAPVTVGPGGFFNTGPKPAEGAKSPYKKPENVRRDADKKKTPEDKTKREARERERFEDVKRGRRTRVEDGGKRTVIEEPDKRRIVREKGRYTIRHDEDARFRRLNVETRRERNRDGNNVMIVLSPGGIRVFTEEDRYGRPLRRWRRYPDGREMVLYDNRSYYRRFHGREPSFTDAIVVLPPPRLTIPRERYIVEYDRASDDDIYETLSAPPVEALDNTYSLEEVRQSEFLRDRMRRIDLDTITFDFGSWDVGEEDYPRLERVARVISRILDNNPEEVFLIEGHTDAVGDEEDNLTLSDRRAESVAIVLSEEFGVPPENLTTQGYGEQLLKIDTQGPERLNRYVSVRRITPLLAHNDRDR